VLLEISPEQFREYQQKDKIIQQMLAHASPESFVEDGVAYRVITNVKLVPEQINKKPRKAKGRTKDLEEPGIVHKFTKVRKQVLVPAALVNKLLQVAHSGPLAGHPGITRCRQSLEKNYYWPTMGNDIIKHIKSCPTCQVVGKGDKLRKIP
jgi:hypothetical protein